MKIYYKYDVFTIAIATNRISNQYKSTYSVLLSNPLLLSYTRNKRPQKQIYRSCEYSKSDHI